MAVDINKVAKILKKDFGSAHVAGEQVDTNECVSTGNKSLDLALNGGIAFGSVFEFAGKSQTGKSTLLQKIVANAQKDYNSIAIWIDRENAWYNERAEQIGVNLDNIIVAKAIDVPTVPDATKFIKTALDNIYTQDPEQYVIIVIDSVSAFMPTVDIGKSDMGNVAKHIHALFRVCLPSVNSKTLLGYVLHITYKTGVTFGNPMVTTSGEAPKYYANYRMQLTDKRQIIDEKKGGEALGNWIEAEVIKTRRGAGHRVAKIPLLYKEGIPYYGGYVRLLCDRNYLSPKNKAEFNKFLQKTVVDSEGSQFHEKDDIKKLLEKHPELDFNEYPEYNENN